MKVVMALWVVPDFESYNENVPFVDYTNVDYGKLHSLITHLFGFGQYPKLSVINQVIDSIDWDAALAFGEIYSQSYLESYETLAISMEEKQLVSKIIDLRTSALLLHQQNYEKNKAPPPVCIPLLVKDDNLTNLREWLIFCREKIDVRDENPMFHPEIFPKKENGFIKFKSKGHLRDRYLNELSKIFGVRYKSEVMLSFMSKKSMHNVLGMKKTHMKLCKKV
jgi:hypothetical protein